MPRDLSVPEKDQLPTARAWSERYASRMGRVRASEIRELLKLLDQPDILSFAGGIPDPKLFPTGDIAAGYQRLLADPATAAQALQYSVSEGLPSLRRWIAERMARWGVPCEPENILITAGSQQALDFLGKLFLSPGDTVLVDRPTYMGALGAFNAYEPTYAGLPEAATSQPTLGYFVPDFANPTGRSLTVAEREGLLDLATAGDFVLIEDAAYRELCFTGEERPTLLGLDIARSGSIEAARTLLCGTFSKTLSPALRLGWICGPSPVIEKLVLIKQGADLHVSTINQLAACEAVAQGYDQHLSRLRAAYGRNAQAMQTALAEHMPAGVSWSAPEGGMFVWLTLPEGIDGARLLERALREERLAFVPGAPFFADQAQANTIRLSYSLPSEAQIDDGMARLARVIARAAAAG
ncbi:MAG TPA: PLP-dependent aminotransferase family protein [Phenylobacterium sp.]